MNRAGNRVDYVTKAAIYAAMRDVNGLLAWARDFIRGDDLERALAQCEAAQVSLALAKARIRARMDQS